MNAPCKNLVPFFPFVLHVILLSCMDLPLSFSATIFTNQTDHLSLIAFKDQITEDPLGALTSWNSSLHFCDWYGVTCSSRHQQRVKVLNITVKRLVGSLSPHIANLSFLRFINLSGNSFYGIIPQEIGRLRRLRYLGLSGNSLGGEIPINLTRCSDLKVIDLYQNQLVGKIPAELGTLPNLVHLYLGINKLTGGIPLSLGNLSSLTILDLSQNGLQGSIPNDLSRLSNLTSFQVNENQLSGTIPLMIFNISSIVSIDCTANRLHGLIPRDIGLTLPNLENLYVGGNQFTGPIPTSLFNASALQGIYFGYNRFTGSIPSNLGNLQSLWRVSFSQNLLGSKGSAENDLGFITSLTNCTLLMTLGVDNNFLSGSLPKSIANLSILLTKLYLANNLIYGSIPTGIENLLSLNLLSLNDNLLMGTIPASIGKLVNLEGLALGSNRLGGQIPSSLGNLTRMTLLYLHGNSFDGAIPLSLGYFQFLEYLDLSQNKLSGSIPREVLAISSRTRYLNLSHNSFTGSLLMEVNDVKQIQELDVSKNKLSGEIPSGIGSFHSLTYLDMDSNSFQGNIPATLSGLKSILFIALSNNHLSGQIPKYLGKFPFLQYLNLSFNDLEGEIPNEGVFRNVKAISVTGNKNLCGGIPELEHSPCPKQSSNKQGMSKATTKIVVITVVLSIILISSVLFTLYWTRKRRNEPSSIPSMEDKWLQISYADLLKATDGFSEANLIGAGSYGHVYKGILDQDQMVIAVKVLDLQKQGASKSFTAECEALRHVRHRNLVKIISACSSIDFKGNDFKALVFDYMPNGSLDEWLHPTAVEQNQFQSLNLIQRLNIAIDVASGLNYLHHHCQTPIVHCDLKPNNILLDNDMVAHVGDFGLAKLLFEATDVGSHNRTNSIAIKGSIGYVAPEYGTSGEVSTQGDVYSYGVLLLEMFTGKRPTDEMFKDGLSLHNFVKMAIPDRVLLIVDHEILQREEREVQNIRSRMSACLISLFEIGILCSSQSPKERLQMKDVAMKMVGIRDSYLGVGLVSNGPQ